MRKALVVGINYYEKTKHLKGCVKDAYSVSNVLERHMDGVKNFDVKQLTAIDSGNMVTRRQLKDNIEDLFAEVGEVSIFYFSGHGSVEQTGGYLLTSECSDGDDGMPLDDLLKYANESKVLNKIIILDSCYSGAAGNMTSLGDKSLLSEGLTILTASSKDQYASEVNASGVFTSLMVDALNGGAANLLGDVTPGSVYAHIDQSLSTWQQRPIFKTNVRQFISLRKVIPPISLTDLKQLTTLFNSASYEFPLDPSYEPQPPIPNHGIEPIPENTAKFAILQKLNRVNLVKPVGEDHMYFAAINSKACRLTVLGEHYWTLFKNNRI